MRVFAFVHRQKADFTVKTLCRVCRVSTSGYYDWAEREAAGPTANEAAEADVAGRRTCRPTWVDVPGTAIGQTPEAIQVEHSRSTSDPPF